MSPETRSSVMARIKGKDTGPERLISAELVGSGLDWENHVVDLPGRPDFVFRVAKVAVFVDGDFWHGWHFSKWRHKLSEKWEKKIQGNRTRDIRNHRRLRRMGWKVVRIWEHEIKKSARLATLRIIEAVNCAHSRRTTGANRPKPGIKQP